jgi:hypothetical protein
MQVAMQKSGLKAGAMSRARTVRVQASASISLSTGIWGKGVRWLGGNWGCCARARMFPAAPAASPTAGNPQLKPAGAASVHLLTPAPAPSLPTGKQCSQRSRLD